LVIIVNLSVIFVLIRDELDIGIPEEERALMKEIRVLNPGKFRKLMKVSGRHRTVDESIILDAGRKTDRLFYLADGEAEVRKNDKILRLGRGSFLGEIAFLTGNPASATVALLAGSNCIVWNVEELTRLMDKDAAIDIAIRGLLNRDMAMKVANSSLA
ncbi:MAG: cyclic nucleotide-binding domain-containing protein, partial [Alphaproteobacteria bacterium]